MTNNNQGWIKLHRRFTDHPFWQEHRAYSKAEAWIDILLECNHAERKVLLGDVMFLCKRGESLNSIGTWAKRWGWNKSKVNRFLTLLTKQSMIVQMPNAKTKHLSVCKYETYQGKRNANESQMNSKRIPNESEVNTNKNDKNDKNDKNKKRPKPSVPEVLLELWDRAPKTSRQRSSKKQMVAAWKKIPAEDRPDSNDLLLALEAWKASSKWQCGKYCEGIHRWVSNQQWDNIPEPNNQLELKTVRSGTFKIGGRTGHITSREDIENHHKEKETNNN